MKNISFWMDVDEKKENYPILEGENKFDIAIVGGGLFGLLCAYFLSKEGKKVCVIEKDLISSHTSGNNTGKITSQHGLFYDYLLKYQKEGIAKQYFSSMQDSISGIYNIINEENISCDFEWQDSYVFVEDKKDLKLLEDEKKAVDKISGKSDFCKLVNLKDIPNYSESFALKFSNQAQFNNYLFCLGLGKAITKYGGTIYENSRVNKISKQKLYKISSDKGCVIANKVIIATRYPIINVPGFYFLKEYQSTSYTIAGTTNSNHFEGMYISNKTPSISFRTSKYKDGRILIIAGMDHKTGQKPMNICEYSNLEKIAKNMYPDFKLLYKWQAEDTIGLDKIPYIGMYSTLLPDFFTATGFKKWGISTSYVAALKISNQILKKEASYSLPFSSTRFNAIKNHKEFGNMIKDTSKSLILEKFKIKDCSDSLKETINKMPKDSGGIFANNTKKIGIYKSENGEVFLFNPICPHLGCNLNWNSTLKTWDCPCHGSRFSATGSLIECPSTKDLDIKNKEE